MESLDALEPPLKVGQAGYVELGTVLIGERCGNGEICEAEAGVA